MTNWLRRNLLTVLSGLVASLAMTLAYLRGSAPAYAVGQEWPRPSGYMLNGNYIGETQALCYLIRLTADNCPYCRQDQTHYQRLVAEARRAQCQIVMVGPHKGDVAAKADAGVVQLEYVNMSLGRALTPFSTPQTLLMDKDNRLVWHREGSLSDGDAARAIRILERIIQK